MNKLRLFYVYKFDTNRLKEYNNNIAITIEEARKNGELVSIGDSQLLRTIKKIVKSNFSEESLSILEKIKKTLEKKDNTKNNRFKLQEIQKKIMGLLHIPEYISIIVKNKSDYKKIIRKGFKVNGIKYKRLICGASHSRKNTVIFCAEHIEEKLKKTLQNGMKKINISHLKYNAYFALYSSATHVVSNPRVCVVPDKIITRKHMVDLVEEHDDGDTVEEKIISLDFNLWDGMGIISPRYARKWAKELGVNDYVPSAFTIRNSFIKGMVCTMPFHAFSRLIAKKKNIINDIWGNEIKDIGSYDVILTESQFKLWKAFGSWEKFEHNCKANDIRWGISRVSPKEEKKYTSTNYQFVQAINLDDDNAIKNLCKPTIEWIEDVCGLDVMKSLLFLSGNSLEDIAKNDTLNIKNVKNTIVKALILNNNIIQDPYIRKKIYSLIDKKIKESYIGKLIVEGNFQVMISDPFAFCEYVFDMEIKGLLKDKEHYSYYWNQKNISTVVAMRSPLTWRSEVNKLNLKNNNKTNTWFKYLKSGIIYPIYGIDCMLAADSDYDYDIVATTNCPEFVENNYGGLPVTYEKKTTLKSKFDEKSLFLSDLYSFNSKIGYVTNCSTIMYCMLAEHKKDSLEYIELIKRLKICRKEQGSQIDKAKGIIVKEFPSSWFTEQEIFETDDEITKNKKILMNNIIIKKKPYFMRWLYPDCNKRYKKHKNNADIYCSVSFGYSVSELMIKNNRTDKENQYLDEYIKYCPLNEVDCSMNRLSKYIECIKFDIKKSIKNSDFDYKILMNNTIKVIENNMYGDILSVYKNYITNKHLYASIIKNEDIILDDDEHGDICGMYEYYKNKLYEICSNSSQLTNIIIDICYRKHISYDKDFIWNIFSNELIENIYKNKQNKNFIPKKNNKGGIKYLGENYIAKEVCISENFE